MMYVACNWGCPVVCQVAIEGVSAPERAPRLAFVASLVELHRSSGEEHDAGNFEGETPRLSSYRP